MNKYQRLKQTLSEGVSKELTLEQRAELLVSVYHCVFGKGVFDSTRDENLIKAKRELSVIDAREPENN